MVNDIAQFREDLDDSRIAAVAEKDGSLAIDLVLWNEDRARLSFSNVVSHTEPITKKIDFIYETEAEEKGYSLFSLTNNTDEVVCKVVAKGVDFEVADHS